MINKFFKYTKENLSLESVNKLLLFLALVSLFMRSGSFYNSFIPKPFEIIFTIVVILTAIYLLKNNKIKEFFASIPKKIWIAIACLLFSVLFGWAIAILFKRMPFSLNMVLEFGTFIIGLGTFLLILFYTKNNQTYAQRYFYALFSPIIYIIFIVFPEMAYSFNLGSGGKFFGFINNPNIFAKTLLIPIIFFLTHSLFETKNKWLKIIYIFISSALVALLFWTASRGALLSFVAGTVFVWFVFLSHNFHWKKIFSGGGIIFLIILLGFTMVPYSGKQTALNRILNFDDNQSGYNVVKNKSITEITRESFKNQKFQFSETRLEIWPFYLKYMLKNPLGIGPNTHLESNIPYKGGGYLAPGPHNSYIQILLWGGLLGLFSFLYILFSAFKNLKIKLQSNFNPTTVAVMGALFILSIAIMFDDSLSFYWFWAILALSFRI